MSPSPYGSSPSNRLMTVYKRINTYQRIDPIEDATLTTGLFRELGQAEGFVMGNQYGIDPYAAPLTTTMSVHWLYNGTGATPTTTVKGIVGYEIGVSSEHIRLLAADDRLAIC